MTDTKIGETSAKSKPSMTASNFRPLQKNTLQGFFDLTLQSGMCIKECSWHKSTDKEWIGLPGKPQLDRDGNVRRDPNGKIIYTATVTIDDRATRERFMAQALQAVYAIADHG